MILTYIKLAEIDFVEQNLVRCLPGWSLIFVRVRSGRRFETPMLSMAPAQICGLQNVSGQT